MTKFAQIEFCVITDVRKGPDGNYFSAPLETDGKEYFANCYIATDKNDDKMKMLGFVKMPCFHLGEMLVLDSETGREMTGLQRKPAKWFIGYEIYEHFEDAVRRSMEIAKSGEVPLSPTPLTCTRKMTAEQAEADSKAKMEILKGMSKDELEAIPGMKGLMDFFEGGMEKKEPAIFATGLNKVLDEKLKKQRAESN